MSLKSSIHVRIWKKDIKGAKRDCWDHCPLCRALRRAFPGNWFQVFDTYLVVNGEQLPHTESTKAFALGWNEGPMSPTTVEMPPQFEAALRTVEGGAQ